MSDDAALSFTFQYHCFASDFRRSVELHNFAVNCSKVGIGWCSLLMASFRYFGSKQMHKQPSTFSLITRLFNYLVGPVGVYQLCLVFPSDLALSFV